MGSNAAMRRQRSLAAGLSLLLAAALGLGCVSDPSVSEMAVRRTEVKGPSASWLEGAVALRDVTGGEDSGELQGTRISDEGFRAALEETLREAGWLSPQAGAGYVLDAEMGAQETELSGLDRDAWLSVRYRLFPTGSQVPLYDHTLRAGYRVLHRNVFWGAKKLRIGFEQAAHENLKAFRASLGASARP